MIQDFLTRQLDLLPVELLGESITVIGAGAIGSFTVLQLAKLGFSEIKVFDDDVVSVENMNSQFYRVSDIDKPKVEALREIVKDFTGTEIEIVNGRYEEGTFKGLIIVAVDNMATRKLVFENHELRSVNTKFILDPRMGAETAVLHVVDPMNEEQAKTYLKTLFDDSQAVEERCTAKATMYTVNLLSGLIAKTVKDIVTKATYLKNVNWDVKTFALQAWNSVGTNPNLIRLNQPTQAPRMPLQYFSFAEIVEHLWETICNRNSRRYLVAEQIARQWREVINYVQVNSNEISAQQTVVVSPLTLREEELTQYYRSRPRPGPDPRYVIDERASEEAHGRAVEVSTCDA